MAACLSASADALAAASARSARTDDTSGGDYLDIACVFGELEMPSAVTSHVGQTTSMDGRQTETWEGISISWSYHPDRGLDGVLTVDEDDAS